MASLKGDEGVQPDWYTRKEAAAILGVSESAIRKYEAQGELPNRKDNDGGVLVSGARVRQMAEARDSIVTRATAHLEAIYKSRLAVIEDLRAVIEEQRKEGARKDLRIESLEGKLSELHAREAETLRAVEQVATLRHERELEMEQFRASEQRKNAALGDLRPLVGALAQRFGAKGLPGSKDGTSQTIAALRDSLTAEQSDVIMQALRPEQLSALMLLFDGAPGGEKDSTAQPAGQGMVENPVK